jgi:hypothetical protein
VYDVFMPATGWARAAVWGCAVACWLVNDRVKLAEYRALSSEGSLLEHAVRKAWLDLSGQQLCPALETS